MIDRYIFDIKEIIQEERLNRIMRVTLKRCFYDGIKIVTIGFFPTEWEAYKANGCYPENRALDEKAIQYYENMPEAEWCKSRYDAKLKDFSDEEIVEEFNRRLNLSLFHDVGIEAKAVIMKRR